MSRTERLKSYRIAAKSNSLTRWTLSLGRVSLQYNTVENEASKRYCDRSFTVWQTSARTYEKYLPFLKMDTVDNLTRWRNWTTGLWRIRCRDRLKRYLKSQFDKTDFYNFFSLNFPRKLLQVLVCRIFHCVAKIAAV